MTDTDRAGDRLAGKRCGLIADKIRADPSVLGGPLATIDRWLGDGHGADTG
jgi:hypothetical protein